jgi:hypothetical protein
MNLFYTEWHVPDERRKLVKSGHGHVESDTSLTTLIPKKKIFKTGESGKIFPNAIGNLEKLDSDRMIGLAQKVLEEEIVALLKQSLQVRLDLKGLISKEIQLKMGSHNKGVESCEAIVVESLCSSCLLFLFRTVVNEATMCSFYLLFQQITMLSFLFSHTHSHRHQLTQ